VVPNGIIERETAKVRCEREGNEEYYLSVLTVPGFKGFSNFVKGDGVGSADT
jgi:hypothetical protein